MAVLAQLIDPSELLKMSPSELEHLSAIVHNSLFSEANVKKLSTKVNDALNKMNKAKAAKPAK